jgi:hypothetical protein
VESKPGAGTSTFPDGTGIDNDGPEIFLASVTFADKTDACSRGNNCFGTDVPGFGKSEKTKMKLC